jgi:hypothetical protein
VLWFDIPPFASRGVAPARKLFDDTFANFESCKVDILELDATVNGDMGIVCTVQSTDIVLKSGATKHVMVRQTDCFELGVTEAPDHLSAAGASNRLIMGDVSRGPGPLPGPPDD